jgi:hypothetical protein
VAFLKNRASRILAPFFLAMLAFFPILTGMQRISRGWTYARTWDWLIAGQFLKWLHPMHLWFLWYLALLYVIAIVVLVASRRAGLEPVRENGRHPGHHLGDCAGDVPLRGTVHLDRRAPERPALRAKDSQQLAGAADGIEAGTKAVRDGFAILTPDPG